MICKFRLDIPPIFSLLDRNDGWEAFLSDFLSSVEYLTGQPINLRASSQDRGAIKEELETLRSKVDELTEEVGRPSRRPCILLTQHPMSSGINSAARLINRSLRSIP